MFRNQGNQYLAGETTDFSRGFVGDVTATQELSQESGSWFEDHDTTVEGTYESTRSHHETARGVVKVAAIGAGVTGIAMLGVGANEVLENQEYIVATTMKGFDVMQQVATEWLTMRAETIKNVIIGAGILWLYQDVSKSGS